MKFPPVSSDYFPLGGGLDLLTPAISLKPGQVTDAQNYEPQISGGYRRINGFERYDGHAAPTGTNYWMVPVNQTGTISVGNTITGASSGATCKVLAVITGYVVAGRLTGTFTNGENITISAVVVGSINGSVLLNGASSPSDDSDYALLAANDQRLNISAVPGSGQIRGVWVYKDVVYAFRDNVGGTAGLMYKATASSWQQITFGTELQFSGATGQISAGNTITGATSGATATVTIAMLRSGTWTASGAGTLILSGVTGTFQNGENIQVGGVTKVVAASASTAITRQPGGRLEFSNYNFTGSTSTEKMYGADGVNLAFEFDGTNYVPIRTGMTSDTPSHVIGYKNYLFLSFLGSVQFSGLGAPYSWTAVLGAGEIATGDPVTGFVPQGGTSDGSALGIFTSRRMHVLYGTSASDFKLVTSNSDIGFSAYTMQIVGNNTFGLTARGIQAVLTTLTYGDFDYASISHLIQPYITLKQGLEIASTTLRTKNQYRLYYSDGTALVVGLTGDKVNGILPLNYGSKVVRCICTATLSNGQEVTYFGSDDGYIYKDNVGTSFDGSTIEAWIRLAFNHEKSPRMRKRFRRAVFEGAVDYYAQVNITYDLGYGNPDVMPSDPTNNIALIGGGGYWDQFYWEQFTWDNQVVVNPSTSLDGTEKSISLLFYSNRAQDQSHTLQGVTLHSTPRRLER
jgi:hypothetical protein